MKKLLLMLSLLFTQTVIALPFGNPSDASLYYPKNESCCENSWFHRFRFGVGFYGDYVFNRHMETVHGKDIDTTKRFTNAGYLIINFCERIELFSALGASRLSLNTSLGAFSSADPHPLFELETESAFSYSVGLRATLIQCHCFALGIQGQYFSTRPNVKRLYIAAGAVRYPDEELITRYTEWQLGAGISYRYNPFFIPYAGVKYDRAFWKLNDGKLFIIESNTTTFLHNLRNQKSVGYVIGLTLYPFAEKKIGVTVEGRFANEKALHVNGQIRF